MSFYLVENTQPQAAEILSELVEQDNVPSSILFCGPSCSGRMFAATRLAQAIGSDFQSTIIISDRNHNYRIKTALRLYREKGNNSSKAFLRETVMTFLSQYNGAMADSQSAANKKKFQSAGDCMDIINSLRDVQENQSSKVADDLEKALNSIIDLKNGPSQTKMTSVSISQVRSIKDWCSTSSLEGKKKTIIIEGIENSSSGAVNALLKTLEEPPEDTCFILISENSGRIPATILSRLRKIRFNALSNDSKKRILSDLFVNPNDYEDLESFFVVYSGVNDSLLRDCAYKAVHREPYNLANLVDELEKTQAWDRFFEHIITEIRNLCLEGNTDVRRIEYITKEINEAVSKSKSFIQTRRMTLEFVLFRIKEVL